MLNKQARVNGKDQSLPSEGTLLVDWLRDTLRLTGTKDPCRSGHCGGCSILLDNEVVLSCCSLASTVREREILTIEGLANVYSAEPLFDAFKNHGAFQCGYCTPGMIVTAYALIQNCVQRHLTLNERMVREALRGNICRCTGYVQIIRAILDAAQKMNTACVISDSLLWYQIEDDLEKKNAPHPPSYFIKNKEE